MVRGQPVANSSSEGRIVEEIEALIDELELLKGEGSVVLVIVNSRDVKEKLINKIVERFNANVVEVKRGQEIIDMLKKGENFEVLILILPDELTEDILNALNNYRELFYRCGFPSVVICNLDTLNKIINYAPDFWRYRGSVYDLTAVILPMKFSSLEEVGRFIDMCNYLLSIVKNDNERVRLLIELADAYVHKFAMTADENDLKVAEDFAEKALKIAEELKNEVLIKEAKDLLKIIRTYNSYLSPEADR